MSGCGSARRNAPVRRSRPRRFDLFERKGFDHTTVDEIVDACDVSRRTFFRYFSSKEEVFAGDHEEKTALFASLLAARPAGRTAARVGAGGDPRLLPRTSGPTSRRRCGACASPPASHDLQQFEAESYDSRLDGLVDALLARSDAPVDDDVRLQTRLVLGAAIVVMRSVCRTVDGRRRPRRPRRDGRPRVRPARRRLPAPA